MDDKPTASDFSSLAVTPIAALSPELDTPEVRYLHAVVILLWPFSSATKQFSLLLSEPDFRLRGGKGQVKAIFREGAAEAVAKSNIGIGDTVFLSLQGAKWRSNSHEDAKQLGYTEWSLLFSGRVLLEAQRTSTPLSIVNFKCERENLGPAEPPVTPKKLSDGIVSPISLANRSWASPAFSRASNAPFSSPLFESHAEEDGYIPGNGRKRTKFGRPSSDWVFVDSAPSPTKEGDMWDDEELVERAVEAEEAPLRPSPEAPSPTKDGVNVEEFEIQGDEGVDRDVASLSYEVEQAPRNGSPVVPPVLNLPEITEDEPRDAYTEPFAAGINVVDRQQPLSPSLPEIETPHLHPVSPLNIPAISPLGTSLGASTGGSLTPADVAMAGPPMVDPATPWMAKTGIYTGNQEHYSVSDGAMRAIDVSPDQENRTSFGGLADVVAQNYPLSRNSEEPPSVANDALQSDSEEELEEQPKDSGHIEDAGGDEVLSVYGDTSSDVAAEEGDRTRAISVESFEGTSDEDEASECPRDHLTPVASDIDESPSPQPAERYSISSDSDTSSDEADENLYPRAAATETTEQEVFVIHDDESDDSESEVESIGPAQGSGGLHSSAEGDSESSIHPRSHSPGKSAFDKPAEANTYRNAVETQGSSIPSDIHAGDKSPSPTDVLDDDRLGNGTKPLPEGQTITTPIMNHEFTTEDIHESMEPCSQPSLQQYLSDAICNPTHSHIDSTLVNEENPMDPHGDKLISSFLAPQPTDFITPENTQGSWTSFGSHSHHLSFPIHLDPNLPTPQPSQTTEATLISTSLAEDQSGIKTIVDVFHPPTQSRPSTSSSVSTKVEEARPSTANIQITGTTDNSPSEIHEAVHQKSPSEPAPVVPTTETEIDPEISGLRTKFSYFCPLSRLLENFNQSVDCISIVVDITPINRATQGAKDYYVCLRLTDKSLGGSTTAAQIFHKTRDALPMPAEGDIILLRNFRVQSLNHKMVLNSTDNSAWAYFSQENEEDVQIDGAPVEYGSEEQEYAAQLRIWYVQEGSELVARNIAHDSQRESVDTSSRSTSEAGSQLKNIFKKRRRARGSTNRRITVHELRHGRRYVDVGSPSDNESIHELRNGTLYAHPD
ncbi:uncharacterized protein GIQ15_06496 [Arthroderma uncinatum]|uniref:uncharacterized protein n=1 Tax=Arthroderma uncinatum TaxID=74035 RepID=UPI00144AC208|nr:uncharacterized protein GIQ15_06496 [Arthroderma uncinatum]KAF3479520.1 hypothetical protein GIQ15_06496 [Arthroderma uncinatum]